MKKAATKTAFLLLMIFLLSCVSFAADAYQPGKIVKWENGTYARTPRRSR